MVSVPCIPTAPRAETIPPFVAPYIFNRFVKSPTRTKSYGIPKTVRNTFNLNSFGNFGSIMGYNKRKPSKRAKKRQRR